MFIELNDAPNHNSLAREAKMLNRVLRIISAAVFSEGYSNFSTSFILGNADFLKLIETVQFELKGTPAAAEIELLNFLLENNHQPDPKPDTISEYKENVNYTVQKITAHYFASVENHVQHYT